MILCSVCKKNMAVIFLNKFDKEGKPTGETTGLCVECAKKQGIDPLSNIMKEMENISPEDMENMSKQLDGMLGGLGLNNMDDSDEDVDDNPKPKIGFGFSNLFGNKKDTDDDQKEDKKERKKRRKTKYLDTFGENLTQKARDGKLDRVIGRQRELARMIQILNRRSKNNPALIGEPGVGKTAIVNALAQEIVDGNVPGK